MDNLYYLLQVLAILYFSVRWGLAFLLLQLDRLVSYLIDQWSCGRDTRKGVVVSKVFSLFSDKTVVDNLGWFYHMTPKGLSSKFYPLKLSRIAVNKRFKECFNTWTEEEIFVARESKTDLHVITGYEVPEDGRVALLGHGGGVFKNNPPINTCVLFSDEQVVDIAKKSRLNIDISSVIFEAILITILYWLLEWLSNSDYLYTALLGGFIAFCYISLKLGKKFYKRHWE